MTLDRHITITTPLDEELLLSHMVGHEALGRLFEYNLELLSENSELKPTALLGKSVTVHLELSDSEPRHFNGIVTRFTYAGALGRFSRYHATMRPWLWLLTQVVDSRIFQRLTVPELVFELIRLNGFVDVAPPVLIGSYREREYVVQYRESTFNFISRLLEEEGIYYCFAHSDGAHKLILTDIRGQNDTVEGYEQIPFYPRATAVTRERDHFETWRATRQIIPAMCRIDAFDFEKPRMDLTSQAQVGRDQDQQHAIRAAGHHRERSQDLAGGGRHP